MSGQAASASARRALDRQPIDLAGLRRTGGQGGPWAGQRWPVGGPVRTASHRAEGFVVDELDLFGLLAAHAAVGILAQLERAELGAERVEHEQSTRERLADAEDQLDRLVRLHRADQPR